MARISIITASAILLFFGLLHLHDTFYSADLHPDDPNLVIRMQLSHIRMSESGNLWKLWLGFNAMFSAGLIFIAFTNLYLFAAKFQTAMRMPFILLFTILTNAFLVWIGLLYMITEFAISMSIPLVLFVTGFTIMQFKSYSHHRKKLQYENHEQNTK